MGNVITGAFGTYVDSFPMFIVCGLAKRGTTVWCINRLLHQLGDQEVQIVETVNTMTKYAMMIELREAYARKWRRCSS